MFKKTTLVAIILLRALCFAQSSSSDISSSSSGVSSSSNISSSSSGVSSSSSSNISSSSSGVSSNVSLGSYGILNFHSSVPAGVWINGQAIGGNTPVSIKLPAGWAIYSARAPGYWPEVAVVNVKQGAETSREIMLKKHKIHFNEVPEMPDLSSVNDIKTLESLYDSLAKQKPKALHDSICITSFTAEYPPLAPSQLKENSAEYHKYYTIYDEQKQSAFKEMYAGCLGPIQQNMHAILMRLRELGSNRITGIVPVVGADFQATDLTGLNGNLILFLRSPDGRAEVAWKGVWKNEFLIGSELVKALTASPPIALAFLTTQNQAMWIPVENGYSRHFYKYHELNISWNALLIPMEGEFILPDYILARLGEAPKLLPNDTLPNDTLPKDTLPKDTLEKIKTDIAFLSKIPGGNFVYKGKLTDIRPFSINTREINQSLYKTKCGEKNFGKLKGDSLPAHSVTWKEANSCCAALGGDLPTEAEWEYAARAGIPYKYIWQENDSAKNYAVFNAKKAEVGGGKKSNGWGLYDMFGNVAEWVKDDGFWNGKYKFLKGGSYKSKEKDLSVENREEEDTRYWGTHVGFRCVYK